MSKREIGRRRREPERKFVHSAARSWRGRFQGWLRSNPILVAILLLGFALRTSTLLWGIPISPYVGFYHPDEVKSWSSTVGFPENYFSSRNYLYGCAVQYSVGLLLLPLKLLLANSLGMKDEYVLLAIILFRIINVVLGTGSVLLTYFLGCRFGSKTAGLIAAAMLSVAFTPTLNSPLTTLDVSMSLLVPAGLLQIFHALEKPQPQSFVVLGLITGLLMGTKITGGLFFCVAAMWLFWRLILHPETTNRQMTIGWRWELFTIFGVSAVATFLLSTPQILFHFAEYWRFMQNQKATWYDNAPWSPMRIANAWLAATNICVSAPVGLFALLGICIVCRRYPADHWPLTLFLLVNYVFWQGYLLPRFVVPVAPLLCLFAGIACERLLASPALTIRYIGWIAVTAALAWPSSFTLGGIVQKMCDPRTIAAEFISQQIPEGASIGTATDHGDQWQHHEWHYPHIDFTRYRDIYFVDRPEYVVMTSLERDTMQAALQSEKLSADLKWNAHFRAQWYLSEPPPPEVFGFYRELYSGTGYDLMASFRSPVNLPFDGACPEVFVYKRKE